VTTFRIRYGHKIVDSLDSTLRTFAIIKIEKNYDAWKDLANENLENENELNLSLLSLTV
jgi:hypothetical protein